MNTQLEKLFQKYSFSTKDCHDFLQIFALLPNYKKVRAVEQFEDIAQKISGLKQELHIEQQILFGKALQNIESQLGDIGKKQVLSMSREDISLLKNAI